MRMASCGFISNACKVMLPRRSIPELATNTPSVGRLVAQSGFRAWCVGPTLSRTRKWTQPQERKKAKTGGDGGGVGERRVELVEELKGRNLRLPNRRASSLAREWLSEVKRATSERPVALLDWKNWEKDNRRLKCNTLFHFTVRQMKLEDTVSPCCRSVHFFEQRLDARRRVLCGKEKV